MVALSSFAQFVADWKSAIGIEERRIERHSRLVEDIELDSLQLYETAVWLSDQTPMGLSAAELDSLETAEDAYKLTTSKTVDADFRGA